MDIITFGSRVRHEHRSKRRAGWRTVSLFYQAIRIIKEMSCATNGRYREWICWENVVGPSVQTGLDFKTVLEAVIRIIEPGPGALPEKNRWPLRRPIHGRAMEHLLTALSMRNIGESPSEDAGLPCRRSCRPVCRTVLFGSEGLSGYSAEGCRLWKKSCQRYCVCIGAQASMTTTEDLTACERHSVSTVDEYRQNGIVLNDQGGGRMGISRK